MRFAVYASVLAFTVLGSPVSSQKAAPSLTSQHAEILRHFRALVQIDTSNPPGNEVKVVDYLKKVLAAEGIPSKILALDPNRPNLVARSEGQRLEAAAAAAGAHRRRWRAARQMAGRSVRSGAA